MRRLLWIVAAVALMSAGTAQAQQDVRQRIEGLCAANTQQFAAVANPSVERESIPASTLVEQMAAGVPVEVNGAVITGNLDLNPLLAAGRDGTPVAVRQPVTLADATLDGNLIIPDALQVTAPFSLTGTVITGSVSIGQATFEQPVDFDRVQFGGAVTLTRPTFAAPASFVNVEMLSLVSFVGVTFADVADFSDARIEDQIAFVSNTAFQQNALFDRASFSQRLSFNTVTFERDTYFTEVSFCGSTRLQGITARGIMDFQGSGFASDLRIEAGSRMEADVYLTDTIMDGNLRVRSSAVISGDLLLSGMEFTSGNSLLIQDSTLNGDVDGVSVNFRSSDGLRMVESTFGGELDFTDAQFSETGSFTLLESVFNGDLSLNRALFNNTVSITRSDVNAVADMRGAQFFDNVFIEESTFNDELLFRGATFNAAIVDFHESDFDRIDLSSVSLQPG
ncbi:MAG: pentapeptide repeat-containing protein, partial [Chloroflexota bacterium]